VGAAQKLGERDVVARSGAPELIQQPLAPARERTAALLRLRLRLRLRHHHDRDGIVRRGSAEQVRAAAVDATGASSRVFCSQIHRPMIENPGAF